jgi:hypothetical protein
MKNESPRRGQNTARATAVGQVKQTKSTAPSTLFQARSIVSAITADRPNVRRVEPHKG